MESLETELRRIAELRGDLSASLIIQEERGHDEVIPGSDRGSGPCSFDKVWDYQYVVDQPEITEPDTAKRESARALLQDIYDSSEWYSARYAAGWALGKDLNDQFELWIETLKERLQAATSDVTRQASKDLEHMYQNLPNMNHRRIAGKALGYSGLRIWAHENPAAAQIGIAAAGAAACGLGYLLMEYLNR